MKRNNRKFSLVSGTSRNGEVVRCVFISTRPAANQSCLGIRLRSRQPESAAKETTSRPCRTTARTASAPAEASCRPGRTASMPAEGSCRLLSRCLHRRYSDPAPGSCTITRSSRPRIDLRTLNLRSTASPPRLTRPEDYRRLSSPAASPEHGANSPTCSSNPNNRTPTPTRLANPLTTLPSTLRTSPNPPDPLPPSRITTRHSRRSLSLALPPSNLRRSDRVRPSRASLSVRSRLRTETVRGLPRRSTSATKGSG